MSNYPQRFAPILRCGDARECYAEWPEPTIILSDGAYGIGGFPGDPETPDELHDWYEPHIEAWSKAATSKTTLWFWNTEIGWATMHPILAEYGWMYRSCNIWDKGIAHVAGNVNSQTMRKFPVVTEVCAQYIREPTIPGGGMSVKDWLRGEWIRAGLTLAQANKVCGVKNAATRKYLTSDDLWYCPPTEAYEQLVNYANEKGLPEGRPYFSIDGKETVKVDSLRAKFTCGIGITNVWREATVRGNERLKDGPRVLHSNQKPLRLMELILGASSDPGDNVWEPFGGTCSFGVAAFQMGRAAFCAEKEKTVFQIACDRVNSITEKEDMVRKQMDLFELMHSRENA
jgi:hypothetical protein